MLMTDLRADSSSMSNHPPSSRWVDLPVERGCLRVAAHLVDAVRSNGPNINALFDPSNTILGARAVQSGGRQSAWFVQGAWGNALLRHYRRGGLVAKLSKAHYIWQGACNTRSFAELALLDRMYHAGLPVPQPLAAAYWKNGLVYRAAIVVARLEGVKPLADTLETADAVVVAAAILKMHDAGVWHADLNAFNILLDSDGRAWLIDFDRGRERTMSKALRTGNLQRLRRSLNKVAAHKGDRFAQALDAAYWQLAAA